MRGGIADQQLRQALALAIVKQRRDSKWRAKAEGLEERLAALTQRARELEQATEAHPLEALAELQQGDGEAQGSRQPTASAQLLLWEQASLQLPPELQRFCCRDLQRYLLRKELHTGGATAGPAAGAARQAPDHYAALCSALARSPLQAALEAVDDILELVAAAAARGAAAGDNRGEGGAAAGQPALSEAHGRCLAQAAQTIAALVGSPAAVRGEGDVQSVQHFLDCLLRVACQRVEGDPAGDPAAAAAATPAAAAQAAPDPQIPVVGQSLPAVARALLGLLTRYPSTGMLALGGTAAAARGCMHSLVCAVTGERLTAPGQPAASGPGQGGEEAEAAEDGDEATLHLRFQYIASVLQAQLRALPHWAAELGGCDDAWLNGIAGEIMAAADTCKIVSLSHPATVRQAQRLSALLVSALHQIAAAAGP